MPTFAKRGARSIPAYAGDPGAGDFAVGNEWVYPRLRGGSSSWS